MSTSQNRGGGIFEGPHILNVLFGTQLLNATRITFIAIFEHFTWTGGPNAPLPQLINDHHLPYVSINLAFS